MPRKLRLEFPGAIYHVINRGNYRSDIFRTESAKAAFESCLFAACEKSDWVLHAFVVMRNHYHLAVETPQGNLVLGMQWLQGTFANRFNRLRQERGHLFQGRYKSLVVESGESLGQVCHYIHLNPVRAGIIPVPQLREYRYSSYWYLAAPAKRPPFLRVETALREAGGLADSLPGHKSYAQYLNWQAAEGPAGKSKAYVRLSRGWALGGKEFKAALVDRHNLAAHSRALEVLGAREVRALHWRRALDRALQVVARTPPQVKNDLKSASWKLAVAAWMKQGTQAGNAWLSKELHMGAPSAISRNLTHYRRHLQTNDPLWQQLMSISST